MNLRHLISTLLITLIIFAGITFAGCSFGGENGSISLETYSPDPEPSFYPEPSTRTADSFSFPLSNYYIAGYRFRQWVSGWGYHLGEDAAGGAGTPVYATADGTVKHTRVRTSYGNVVIIGHTLANGEVVCSVSGHLRGDLPVSVGQEVTKGQHIGYLGDSSQNGGWNPHLHFGIRKGNFSDTTDYDGKWRYRGYTDKEDIANEWHNPTDFINSHQGNSSVSRRSDGTYDQAFIDCYNRFGGESRIGHPSDNGGGVDVHRWGPGENGWIQDFTGGPLGNWSITRKGSQGTAYAVRGGIRDNYFSLGGSWHPLGYPSYTVGDDCEMPAGIFPQAASNGWCTNGSLTRFEGGEIYYYKNSPRSGQSFEVHGAIRTKYESYGGTGSFLGFPISNEGDAYPSGVNGKSGRYSRFEGGTINSWDGGTFEVHGKIFEKYQSMEYSKSNLGFPKSDVYTWNGKERSNFEGGYIYIENGTPVVVIGYSAPNAPVNLTATTISTSRIDLRWSDNSNDETSFAIERKAEGGSFSQIATVGQNITSYSDTGLSSSTTYSYRLRACNTNGYSGYSNTAQATTQGYPPASPSNLSATAYSSNRIDLRWTDSSSNETGFKVERSTNGTSYSQIAVLGQNVTSYSDTGLSPATLYYYRARSYNSNGDSGYSNWTSATTPAISYLPASPDNLTAKAVSSTAIELRWNDNSSNETGFKIERSRDGYSFYEIGTVGQNVTSFYNSGLSPDTTYYYRIRSYNSYGYSNYSSQALAITLTSPSPPTPTPTETPTPPPSPTPIPSPTPTGSPNNPSPGYTPPPTTPGGSTGGCFIATAAYGSNMHDKVMILKKFRDNVLLKSEAGCFLVKTYYSLSPPIAAIIAKHETLRAITRMLLYPIVLAVEFPGTALIILASLLVMVAGYIKWRKSLFVVDWREK